jgi:hypothetical protein
MTPSKTAIVLWLYYPEQWSEIYNLLKPISSHIKLYVGLCNDQSYSSNIIQQINEFDNLITFHDNFGADVAPFIQQILLVQEDFFIKIHTKKSTWGSKAHVDWKSILFNDLIGSANIFHENLNIISNNPQIGMISNDILLLQNREHTNRPKIIELCYLLNINYFYVKNNKFPAGNMFLSRTKLFQNHFNNISVPKILKLLNTEPGKVCDKKESKYAHSLERIFGYIVQLNDLTFYTVKHNTIKIINNDAPNNYFTMIITYNNCCYLLEDMNAYGKIIDNNNNTLSIEWYHLTNPIIQQYAKLQSDIIHKKDTIIDNNILSNLFVDYNPKLYKMLNPDLYNLSTQELNYHFAKYGHNIENRQYRSKYSYSEINTIIDKCNNLSNHPVVDYVLINHSNTLTGAPMVLLDLNKSLTDHGFKTAFIDSIPSDSYYVENVMYHANDPNILKNILTNITFKYIISNSLNIYLRYIENFTAFLDRTIFYFHESYNGYYAFTKDKSLISETIKQSNSSIFVVSEKIKENFVTNGFNVDNLNVSPPIITKNKINKINELSLIQPHVTNIINTQSKRSIDTTKVIYAMCGSIDNRKNFELFIQLSKTMPQFEFLWIGGSKNSNYSNLDIDNLFIIPQTHNPYQYIKMCDYFLLTSKDDPCPIVVLESLLLNKKIIVLDKNIKYYHNPEHLENYHIIKNHNNDANIISSKIINVNPNKIPNMTSKNINYIKNNFTESMIAKKLIEINS